MIYEYIAKIIRQTAISVKQISHFSLLTCLFSLLLFPSANALDNTDTAMPVRSSEERIVTEEWAMRLEPGVDPDALANELGGENLGQIGSLPHTYLFKITDALTKSRAISTKDRLKNESRVQWHEQQVERWRFPRAEGQASPKSDQGPDDPLFSDQWHLENTGQTGGKIGADINVTSVWASGMTGNGVVIGIVDDGLEYDHPDMAANYRPDLSYDFNDDDTDPAPSKYDDHGTSSAGVAAARDNDTCGVGAAYRAELAGLRLIARQNTDADEAEALSYQRDAIHIYSNSWGPDDDGHHLEAPGTLASEVLEDNAKNGRNGLGTVYVWAAGNGLASNDNINYDGYANSRFTIAVGAVGHRGRQSDYSEPGAAMLITAPSDTLPAEGGPVIGITTTDLMGSSGDSADDCTDDFGGTSAAAPLAAGVVALMLEANPKLTWRDVQHILVKSAAQNDSDDNEWAFNAAGLHINHKYGFGRVDAAAAVALAASWEQVPETLSLSTSTHVDQSVPDNDSEGIASTLTINQNLRLEHVEVLFNARHESLGDLRVVLTSPAGTQSILAESHSDYNANYKDWKFMTVRNWDEISGGDWTLRVSDMRAGTSGTVDSWELILHGTVTGPLPPIAMDDAAFAFQDTSVTADVLANDRDLEGERLTVTDISSPAHGLAVLNADKTITYTPEKGFIGVDAFSYTISDETGETDQANVILTLAENFALMFDGRDDYVDCGKDEDMNLTDALTIEAWIRPSGWGEYTERGFGRIVDKEHFLFFLNKTESAYNDHSLVFGADHPGNASIAISCTPANSIVLDEWQHVAVTYDGISQVMIYINGIAQPVDSHVDSHSGEIKDNASDSLFIGESAGNGRAFKGGIDEVRIWNLVRPQAEIQSALYTHLSGDEPGLVGYWPMSDPGGGVATDRSGRNNDGAIFGATWDVGLSIGDLTSSLDSATQILRMLTGMEASHLSILSDISGDGRIGLEEVTDILKKISEAETN